jgi:hypothetical protein
MIYLDDRGGVLVVKFNLYVCLPSRVRIAVVPNIAKKIISLLPIVCYSCFIFTSFPSSNLGLEIGFCGIPEFLQARAEILLQIGHDSFSPHVTLFIVL